MRNISKYKYVALVFCPTCFLHLCGSMLLANIHHLLIDSLSFSALLAGCALLH